MLTLIQAHTPERVGQVREMLKEYAASLHVDLCFQNFESELSGLPGDYAPPGGRLLMAIEGPGGAGCVAMRKIDSEICEMKRLYVRPAFRRKGLGRFLLSSILAEARDAGYGRMRLDTLPEMKEAIALYRSFGFRPTEPYRHNPVEGALFLEAILRD